MKQKKKIIIIGVVILISILIFFPYKRNHSHNNNNDDYEWNGGYCAEDGGRLNYIGTGNKVHYQCEECGKNYYFDKVMKYNIEEN